MFIYLFGIELKRFIIREMVFFMFHLLLVCSALNFRIRSPYSLGQLFNEGNYQYAVLRTAE